MKTLINLFLHIFILFAIFTPLHVKAEQVTVQPKIMVVPYVKEGEDIRTVLEEDAD